MVTIREKSFPASGREWKNNHLKTHPDLSPVRRPALPGKLLRPAPSPQAGGAPARAVSPPSSRLRWGEASTTTRGPSGDHAPSNGFNPGSDRKAHCHDFSFPAPSRHFDRDAEQWQWVTMEGASAADSSRRRSQANPNTRGENKMKKLENPDSSGICSHSKP